MSGWTVVLDGVALSGGDLPSTLDAEVAGCLTIPPEGLGMSALRTEDVTYPRRDGVRHFADWYGERIITLEDVQVCHDGCRTCPDVRAKVGQIMQAWSRQCDDVELVIYPDCYDPTSTDRSLNGPYGAIGRPRVAEIEWRRGRSGCATLLLRFDASDQRLYLLDPDGTPGSGTECVTLTPAITEYCRTYERCYEPDGMCYQLQDSEGGGPVTFNVSGTECASSTITLHGALTDPIVENVGTGDKIGYAGTIDEGAPPVVIDARNGTATQGGQSRTHMLTGTTRFLLSPGSNTLRLSSFAGTDDGTAEVCWRPAVTWA